MCVFVLRMARDVFIAVNRWNNFISFKNSNRNLNGGSCIRFYFCRDEIYGDARLVLVLWM